MKKKGMLKTTATKITQLLQTMHADGEQLTKANLRRYSVKKEQGLGINTILLYWTFIERRWNSLNSDVPKLAAKNLYEEIQKLKADVDFLKKHLPQSGMSGIVQATTPNTQPLKSALKDLDEPFLIEKAGGLFVNKGEFKGLNIRNKTELLSRLGSWNRIAEWATKSQSPVFKERRLCDDAWKRDCDWLKKLHDIASAHCKAQSMQL